MFTFLWTFVVLYVLVSMAWPSSRKREADRKQENDRKHQELIAAIEKLERQQAAPPPPPPRPTFGSAERARVLALGRVAAASASFVRVPIIARSF